MTSAGSNSPDVFDVKKLRRLVELMKEHDLAEIDLQQGEHRLRLRRAGALMPTQGDYRATPQAAPPAAASGMGQPPAPSGRSADSDKVALVKSPMVGTFYTAASPESPAFVKVGDHVGPDTTVCIIEAMKVFNEIPAEVSGQIVAVLVENGDPVEFGQPLFKVDTRK